MLKRISQQSLYQSCPRLPKHLLALGEVSPDSGIPSTLLHLIKIRVSQINHCCFCQHMHAQEARNDGERQVRLDVLPAWREAPCFSANERAALAWAESLTLVSQGPVADEVYEQVVEAFGESGLLELTTVILEINSWNRVCAGMQFTPEIED